MFKFDWSYTKYVLAGLAATLVAIFHQPVKVFAVSAFTAVCAYYVGIQTYLIAIGALIIADIITGIWASFRSGEKFSSKKLGRGLIQKSAIYLIMMAAAFEIGKVIQSALHNQTFWLTWVLTLLILLYELSSVIENIVVINPEMVFLKRFSGLFQKVVDKQMDNVEGTLGAAGTDPKDVEPAPIPPVVTPEA